MTNFETSKEKQRNWSRDEHILAFSLYCEIPFGTIHTSNPRIIELAQLLGRSVGAVSYKLANFARLDPALALRGVRGLTHGAKGEQDIWSEFKEHPEDLAYESQRLLSERMGQALEALADVNTVDIPPVGQDREQILKVRVNQSFFRRRILSAYNYSCCVTGLSLSKLLVASHIVPWAEDTPNRLNVRNGLCLNPLHDKAFEFGMMYIDDGFIIRFSKELQESSKFGNAGWLVSFDGQALRLPSTFSPDPCLLKRHRDRHWQQVG